jgi:adenylosuccinate lyase
MEVRPIDERSGTAEMRAVWSEQIRFSCIVKDEVALANAEVQHTMIPAAAAMDSNLRNH